MHNLHLIVILSTFSKFPKLSQNLWRTLYKDEHQWMMNTYQYFADFKTENFLNILTIYLSNYVIEYFWRFSTKYHLYLPIVTVNLGCFEQMTKLNF